MIINTNMASLNTIRQLSMNEKATQSSLAKLSSGFRINSAADDAAGLAISEKMRGQISGLNQASSNAQNGINLVSTAEGALNETTSILQRMRELAVQAGNDTNTSTDRAAMQTETNQLIQEIDRIGNTTQFNTKTLLNGGVSVAATVAGTDKAMISVVGGSADTTVGALVTLTTFTAATAGTTSSTSTYSGTNALVQAASTININGVSFSFTTSNSVQNVLDSINNAGLGVTATLNGSTNKIDLTTSNVGSKAKETIANATGDFAAAITATGTDASATDSAGDTITGSGSTLTLQTGSAKGLQFTVSGTATVATNTLSVTANGGLNMQIGANQGQTMYISIGDMRSAALGVNNIDLSTSTNAGAAVTTIDNAIGTVSTQRANLGAYQNRLEHTINNLGTSSQNITSAEASIRDVDMAAEMTNFQKNNILQQAAQAMLAQANQQPQGVLQLLR